MQACVYLLDNVDSFTYNLVDELRSLGFPLKIYRNTVSAENILQQMQQETTPVLLLLSPGPGAPKDAGCMPELLKKVQGQYPVLGICLGHQAMVEHYGGVVDKAEQLMHGKSSAIEHCGDKMFANLPNPLTVARYHSLIGKNLPAELDILAQYQDMAMAVYQARDKMLGMQFHPESILTSQGSLLLKQSIEFLLKEPK